jgi:TrmH family RNA methyltransferase
MRCRQCTNRRAAALYNQFLLTAAQRDRIDVILVRPRNPLNIGAVARAMANFGFAHLTVVAPYEPHWREARSAVDAEDLLRSATICATLAEAVAACTIVLGTGTLTHRKPDQPVVRLPALAPYVDSALRVAGRVALVLGPEKHGLTRDDLAYCHLLIEIPTDARQPSMNLGQAAAVCLYELALRCGAESAPGTPSTKDIAPSATLDRLGDLIEQTMVAAGYSPRAMQPANRHDLRVLLRRLAPTSLDGRRMMGLFRRILFQLNRAAAPPD